MLELTRRLVVETLEHIRLPSLMDNAGVRCCLTKLLFPSLCKFLAVFPTWLLGKTFKRLEDRMDKHNHGQWVARLSHAYLAVKHRGCSQYRPQNELRFFANPSKKMIMTWNPLAQQWSGTVTHLLYLHLITTDHHKKNTIEINRTHILYFQLYSCILQEKR